MGSPRSQHNSGYQVAGVIQKQFNDLKKEIDLIKSQMGDRRRDGSSCSSSERDKTLQAHVLEEILKNVQELKSSSGGQLMNSPKALSTHT